ncbi:unnamed protein product [Camellia sinensis]
MGSGNWFKSIICLKKAKYKRSKQVKVHTANNKPNGSENSASSEKSGVISMPMEHIAAMRIQAAFRAFRARKAIRHLRGTVKFGTSIEADSVKMQALATLSHIHSWSKIQNQIRERRLYMVNEGRLRQKKLESQLKLESKLQQIEVEWCGGAETMEEIISRVYQREEAAVKRERAMAYAFSHQWRANSGQCFGQAYYDLGKESWGWSWKERWIAVRPWETRVHTQSIVIPNKVQSRPVSKAGKTTNQPATKIVVSVKPASSNGKVTTKATIPHCLSAEKRALREPKCEVLSLHQSENDEAKTKQEKNIV